MSILDNIPCSFRGIPIQIYSYSITSAPQVRIHNGAYWRYPVVEPLGVAPCTIRIDGFIDPSFGIIERPILEAMVIAPGAGMLTVPSKGLMYVNCISCTITENISNIVEVSLEFVQVKSPLGGIVGNILGGSLPDSIGSAIADVQTTVIDEMGSAVTSATNAVTGFFA